MIKLGNNGNVQTIIHNHKSMPTNREFCTVQYLKFSQWYC